MFLKLQTIDDIEVEVINYMMSEDTPDCDQVIFKKGEVLDVDIIDQDDTHYLEVQFGDGSVSFKLPKKWFKVVK